MMGSWLRAEELIKGKERNKGGGVMKYFCGNKKARCFEMVKDMAKGGRGRKWLNVT